MLLRMKIFNFLQNLFSIIVIISFLNKGRNYFDVNFFACFNSHNKCMNVMVISFYSRLIKA